MLCPECSTENADQAEFCTQCGVLLKTEAQQSTEHAPNNPDHEIVSDTTEIPKTTGRSNPRLTNLNLKPDKGGNEKAVVSAGLNIAILLGTLIFPIVGIAMGFAYMRKPQFEARKAGKIWLIFGIVMMIINFIIIYLN